MSAAPKEDRVSVAAIVTYIALGMLALDTVGIFLLIWNGIAVTDVMIGILGGQLSVHSTIAVGAASFWVAGTASGKSTNAAMAQIAGAGPPPPAAPMTPPADDFAIPAPPKE